MIKKERMIVVRKANIAKDTFELVLENSYVSQEAKPGQFIHLLIDGFTLRRPISIADVSKEDQTITIIFKVAGKGTKQLSTMKFGSVIDVLGPAGNGFLVNMKKKSTILLIGGGVGIPPLHLLGKKIVERGSKVISILGYQTSEDVFYEDAFARLGEVFMVTEDGSYGQKGLVTDLLSHISIYDAYYACGPKPMLQAIQTKLVDKPGYISLEERMGCGVGACLACVIKTADGAGYYKICENGPVFKAGEVQL